MWVESPKPSQSEVTRKAGWFGNLKHGDAVSGRDEVGTDKKVGTEKKWYEEASFGEECRRKFP